MWMAATAAVAPRRRERLGRRGRRRRSPCWLISTGTRSERPARSASPAASTRGKGEVELGGHRRLASGRRRRGRRRRGPARRPTARRRTTRARRRAVAGGERGDGVAGLPVPGLDLAAAGGDVDVEGERRGGQQADRAGQAGVDAVVGDQSAPAQRARRRRGARRARRRTHVSSALPRRLAEPALEAAAGGAVAARRGRRAAVRRRRGWRRGAARAASARAGGAARRGSSRPAGGGVVRSMVTMSEPRQFDGQPVLVAGRRRDEGGEGGVFVAWARPAVVGGDPAARCGRRLA